MFKPATELLIDRYYKFSQHSLEIPKKLLTISRHDVIFDCMGEPQVYNIEYLENLILLEKIWIQRSRYRELIVAFAKSQGVTLREDFDDLYIEPTWKRMAEIAIPLLSDWNYN